MHEMMRGSPNDGINALEREEETPEFISLPSEQEVVICTSILDLQSLEPGGISNCGLNSPVYGIWL